jgi:hypothetical protein
MNRLRTWAFWVSMLLAVSGSGCVPTSMGIFTPIPVQPWMADQIEAKMQNPSDYNTVVLGPIPAGYKPLCEDPPDEATILRVMPPVPRGVPYVYEEHRDDDNFVIERLVDQVDPPRYFPLVGPAQLHHCHYKCTVFYTSTVSSDWPIPFHVKRRRSQVVYIDRDHLHQVACTPEQMQSMSHDFTAYQP